ncbi:restriction endonuclease subunit S [Vibrio cholerae]|uniref:restriction endonuclease subunit S n=1 Tax=Vibrio cholerae TaxID=666 RepID=UPI002A221076|nr:restriction endonuclease subunit S [Vibrio cholerae]
MKPILRFQEFNDPIKTKKIRNFCLVKSGATPLRSKTAYFENGHIPWVKTTDLNNGVITSTEEKVTPLALKETSLKIQPANSVLVAMYGGFNQIGRTGLLKEPATTNQALCVLYPKDGVVISSFLQHYLNARVNRWRRFAASSRKDPNITSSDVGSFPVSFGTITEQQKIADFLTAVDTKINQLTEKHRLLKEYKKGVMQQIFSQQLRFKDKDGKAFPEWKYTRLSEVLSEYKCKSTKEDEFEVFTSSRNGLIKQSDYYGENRLTERSNIGFNIIPHGYITFRSRSDDRMFFFNLNNSGKTGLISHYYPVFTMKNRQNGFFIYFSNYYSQVFAKYSVGTSQVVLSFKALGEIKLPIPVDEEQQKIAQFLQALDSKITAVSEQIEQTKQFKKGLLQQMFV